MIGDSAVDLTNYDHNFEFASPDAADPELTNRVLTVMYADEY